MVIGSWFNSSLWCNFSPSWHIEQVLDLRKFCIHSSSCKLNFQCFTSVIEIHTPWIHFTLIFNFEVLNLWGNFRDHIKWIPVNRIDNPDFLRACCSVLVPKSSKVQFLSDLSTCITVQGVSVCRYKELFHNFGFHNLKSLFHDVYVRVSESSRSSDISSFTVA